MVGGGASARSIEKSLAELDAEETRIKDEKRSLEEAQRRLVVDEKKLQKWIAQLYVEAIDGAARDHFHSGENWVHMMDGTLLRIDAGVRSQEAEEQDAKMLDFFRCKARDAQFQGTVLENGTVDSRAKVPGLSDAQTNVP